MFPEGENTDVHHNCKPTLMYFIEVLTLITRTRLRMGVNFRDEVRVSKKKMRSIEIRNWE